MKRVGIRTKFLVAYLVLVLLNLLLIFIIRSGMTNKLELELQQRGVELSIDIAGESIDPILTEDFYGLKLLVFEHKETHKDIEYIFILDHYGELLAHTFRASFPVDLIAANSVKPGQVYNAQTLITEKGRIIDIATPILEGKMATLRVGISENSISNSIAGITAGLLWIFAGIFVFGSAAIIIITAKIINPVSDLTKGAHIIGSGNLDHKVHVKTNDEIGELADSFNLMVDNLKNAKKDLDLEIEERKEAEESLQHERDRAKQYLDMAGVMLVAINADQTVSLINRKGCDILGYDEGEIIGKNWFDNFLAGRDKVSIKAVFAGIMSGEIEPLEYYENHILTKKGEQRLIAWHNALFRNNEGLIIGTLSSGEDISDRIKLEAQLLHAQKMEAVGKLAGGVAHEFNNILTAIINNVYLMKMNTKDDDPSKDKLDKVLSLSNNAAKIASELLAFSRKQHVDLAPQKINDVVKSAESLLANFIGEDIGINVLLTDKDPAIMADRNQIEQVIVNLATNSRDAMPYGGSLAIETDIAEIDDDFINFHGFGEPGAYALLSVKDTGTGIDKKTMKNLFDPFFTTKEVGKGTGLGLSIVYGIVKQHNGYIVVFNETGRGSTFRIYLPQIASEAVMEIKEKPLFLRGNEETLLLAEDEPAVRVAMKKILEEFGYIVIEAVDGKDAIEKFNEHKDNINLLILDVIMPGMNGKEAYEEIKKVTPGIKAIFTSGYTADIIHRKKILKEKMAFVSKPILPDKLLSKIREVIDG